MYIMKESTTFCLLSIPTRCIETALERVNENYFYGVAQNSTKVLHTCHWLPTASVKFVNLDGNMKTQGTLVDLYPKKS